jgi:hypothetical protein
MKLLSKGGAWIMVMGLLLVIVGGLRVHRDPDGTWFQLNLMHGGGVGLLLIGMALTVIAAFTKRNN